MSTISDKVLWNVEVRLVELAIFLNNEVLALFIFPIVVFIMPSSRASKNPSTKLDYTRSIQVLMSKIDKEWVKWTLICYMKMPMKTQNFFQGQDSFFHVEALVRFINS